MKKIRFETLIQMFQLFIGFLFLQATFGLRSKNPPVSLPIKLTIYYEVLCPDSLDFLEAQLAEILLPKNKGSDAHPIPDFKTFLDIQLIPYGKASTFELGNDQYAFTCQHGPMECDANMMHSCVIHVASKHPEVQTPNLVRFLTCTMRELIMSYHPEVPAFFQMRNFTISAFDLCMDELIPINQNLLLTSVALKSNVKTEIENCLENGEGTKLLKLNGDLTPSQLNWVPWVTFNGVWRKRLMDESFKDLRKVLCQFIIKRNTANRGINRSSLETPPDSEALGFIEYFGCENPSADFIDTSFPVAYQSSKRTNSASTGNPPHINHNQEMMSFLSGKSGFTDLPPEMGRVRDGREISNVNVKGKGDRRRYIHNNNDNMDGGNPFGWRFNGNGFQGRDWRWRKPMRIVN